MTTVFVFVRPLTRSHARLRTWEERRDAIYELVYELEYADIEATIVDLARMPKVRERAKGRSALMITVPEPKPAEAAAAAKWQIAFAAERVALTVGDIEVIEEPRREAS